MTSEYYWTTVNSNLNYCVSNQKCHLGSSINECYKKEVCNNKLNSELLDNLLTSNTSSDGRFIDSNDVYSKLLMTTLNLGIGIVVLSTLIIKNSL